MAFQTTRVNGTSQGTINATWYNDFMQALTGVMNDQPIFVDYKPGTGTHPPALKLQTDGNTDLLDMLNSAGATVAKFDTNGIFTTTNQITWNGTLGGSNQIMVRFDPTDAGMDTINVYYNTSNSISFYDATAAVELFQIYGSTGNVTANGIVTGSEFAFPNGWHIKSSTNVQEYWTPQSGASGLGHVFITWNGTTKQTPFSIGGQFESAPAYIDNNGSLFAHDVHVGGSLFGSGGTVTVGDKLSLDGGAITSNGSGTLTTTNIGGSYGTNRNGTITYVPIYTGTTTPASPPTGAIWIKA